MTRPLAALCALCALAPGLARADITALCLERSNTSDAICACADRALEEAVSEADLALYAAIAVRYVVARADGQSLAEAWEASVAEVAQENALTPSTLQARMNPVGRAQRDAIEACR